MQPSRSSQRTAVVSIGGQCEHRCPVCDCGAAPESWDSIRKRLRGGGKTLTILGTPEGNSLLPRVVQFARDEGFGDIIVRTTATAYEDDGEATALAAMGIDAVRVPLFSHDPRVHDRIAGRDGALVKALVGMRALDRVGIEIHLEIPLLPTRLQRLNAVVELALRTVPEVRRARFFVPTGRIPAALAPPPWSSGAPALAEALRVCAEAGVAVGIHGTDAIPLCALRDFPDLHRTYKFNPRARIEPRDGCSRTDVCDACAAREQCPGIAESYRASHGVADIRPWEARPREMYEQRTTPKRVWTDEQREAAAKTDILVLRPTVNCNQDCPFCSANESSNNVWPDADDMRKQIARAARRGIERVSFSGGEPALSPHLASFVRVASRCGVERVEVVTNGALLFRKAKVQELIDSGLTDAFVSLHAHSELISRTMTQKVGDFDKTVQALHHFVDGGIETTVNHVIGARNYRYLENYIEFVHSEFAGKVAISFAFMTPQYKALANMHLVCRISDAMPYLKRGMFRALEIGQQVVVGSRQGIPPCMLGEFAAWSDVFERAAAAISEDQPQKQRSPVCDDCKFTRQCVGLWKPYVAAYGLDELVAVPGEPFSDEEAQALAHWQYPSGLPTPRTFDEVPLRLRHPGVTEYVPPDLPEVAAPDDSEFVIHRSRPLRVAMLGSGRQARRLAQAARQVPAVSVDAIASPHAPDIDLREIGTTPTYRDAETVLDDIQPDAVIVAAATHVHLPLTQLAAERDIPALVEKPLARTETEAEELVALEAAGKARIMMAHNVLYAPGLDAAFERAGNATAINYRRRAPETAPSAPKSWDREAMYQTLYHTVALVAHAAGGGVAEVDGMQFRGDSTPERIRFSLTFEHANVDIQLDYRARVDELSVTLSGGDETVTWTRGGTGFSLECGGNPVAIERDGGEHERMLRAFAGAIDSGTEFDANAARGLEVMQTTRRILEALDAAGAPTRRSGAPKHTVSKAMIQHSANSRHSR